MNIPELRFKSCSTVLPRGDDGDQPQDSTIPPRSIFWHRREPSRPCEHCDAPRAGAADSRFRRILWFALAVNALMFVVEIAASWLSGSMALQADALDFLGDSFNYAISLVAVPATLWVATALPVWFVVHMFDDAAAA